MKMVFRDLDAAFKETSSMFADKRAYAEAVTGGLVQRSRELGSPRGEPKGLEALATKAISRFREVFRHIGYITKASGAPKEPVLAAKGWG